MPETLAQKLSSTASYHVFQPEDGATPSSFSARRVAVRGVLGSGLFFALLIIATLLVALSPTLSRSVTAFFIQQQPGALPWNGTDPVNMLIAGVDTRPIGGATQNTDTIMVVQINPGTDTVHFLSIPRDLYVTIPNYGQSKVNAAFPSGGRARLIKTVEGITNLPIQYYAIINFVGFQKVIDAMGGVTIDVKTPINDPTYPAFNGNGFQPLHIKAGVQHMNGRLALEYVRTRHDDPQGDIGRNLRQQQLMLALKHQALNPLMLLKMPIILDALGNAVHTNFPYTDLTYLTRLIMTAPSSHVEHLSLNYNNNTFTPVNDPVAGSILVPNWPVIHRIAHREFYVPQISGAAVEILNGSGVPGQAGALSSWMHQVGFTIGSVGDADRSDYAQTEVIMNTAVHDNGFVARMAATLLRTTVTSQRITGTTAPVVVIIGRNWTDSSQS